MADPLNYIGIARKAGAIEIGEVNSGAAVRGGKAKLLVLAADASENARKRAESFVYNRKTQLVAIPFTKAQLCSVTGLSGCSMAAFMDTGLAVAFLEKLAENDASYVDAAVIIRRKYESTIQRRKEAITHAKNRRFGKTSHSNFGYKRRKNK